MHGFDLGFYLPAPQVDPAWLALSRRPAAAMCEVRESSYRETVFWVPPGSLRNPNQLWGANDG